MLTEQQHKLLGFIDRTIQARGISPTYEEMADHQGLKAKSGVARLVNGLEQRGFIRKLRRHARGIEVLKPQPNSARTWKTIQSVPLDRTVELYRVTDIHYIIGFTYDRDLFTLEEGGWEDDPERKYPPLRHVPTHWRDVEELPLELVSP